LLKAGISSKMRAILFEIVKSFVTNLFLPLAFLLWLAKGTYSSTLEWLLALLGLGTYVVYVFIAGQWLWFGYYARFAMLGALLLATLRSCGAAGGLPLFHDLPLKGGAGALLLLIFGPLTALALRGYRHRRKAIEAFFPLRNGLYYVAQGGNSVIINHHNPAPPTRFALDIVKLNRVGLRARGIYPRDLSQYSIYGETVYSPADGTVVAAVGHLPDLTPPERDQGNPAGNHIVVKHASASGYVLLAHLQTSSVLVREGQTVKRGQAVARVGNSGNTDEPHLHIHCTTGTTDDLIHGGEGVALLFDGRFLGRNSVVKS
jgi:ABC-type multidrug transport system fused ATPase/permease subunit